MSFDPVTESEILEWHRKEGGHGGRAAGHAIRLLRECVELCVAAGATEAEIKMAVRRECDKAKDRGDFYQAVFSPNITEEFVDVTMLASVFRYYFIRAEDFENEKRRKLEILKRRGWHVDADGVLWRPGTVTTGTSAVEPKSS
jgi:hypothetical protein